MKITSKGQVTIPVAIRQRAGLLPNTEVEFGLKGDVVTLRKAAKGSSRGARLIRALRGTATVRLTTDEILALTRRR